MASYKALPKDVGLSLSARIRCASEQRNIDELMLYYAQDATFLDVVSGHLVSGHGNIQDFYTAAYQMMPKFKVEPQKVTIADNCIIVELKCEGTIPAATNNSSDGENLSSGTSTTVRMVGVTLLWWRWEDESGNGKGDGEDHDQSLDSSLRGWKIFEERAYIMRS